MKILVIGSGVDVSTRWHGGWRRVRRGNRAWRNRAHGYSRSHRVRATRAAEQLESSKDFAKAFMQRHNIPTAAYQTFSDAALAHEYINTHGAPVVIKADGLAAGKGVNSHLVLPTLATA